MPPYSLPPVDLNLPPFNIAEISLFGPGVGECLVIHLGLNRWFVIDSCINRETQNPIALDYLESIGVSFDAVVGVLITHFHADHIEGAYRLVVACQNAKIFMSQALAHENAMRLYDLYRKSPFNDVGAPVRELSQIVDYLIKNDAISRVELVKHKHPLFVCNQLSVRLYALSPSEVAANQSSAVFASMIPSEASPRTALVAPSTENLNAVAVHFSFGESSALLGADLECHSNDLTGWKAILDNGIYKDLGLSKSQFFKVAHHGSETAHHDRLWSELLEDKPSSLCTPYNRSLLPKETDIQRIRELSSSLSITKKTLKGKAIKRDRSVESIIKSAAKSIKAVDNRIGHLQLRFGLERLEEFSLMGNEHHICF